MNDSVLEATRHPGRPAKAHPSKVFSIRLPGEEAVKIERLAAAMGMTTSAYVQRVVQRHISPRKHCRTR